MYHANKDIVHLEYTIEIFNCYTTCVIVTCLFYINFDLVYSIQLQLIFIFLLTQGCYINTM